MEPESSLPQSQASATCPYPGPTQSVHTPTSHLLEIHPNIIHPSTPRFRIVLSPEEASCLQYFLTWMFYREGLLAPHPTPKLEDHPLSAVHDCLFNLFAATLHIGGRSSIRNLRTRHAVGTGTHYRPLTTQHKTDTIDQNSWPQLDLKFQQSSGLRAQGHWYGQCVCFRLLNSVSSNPYGTENPCREWNVTWNYPSRQLALQWKLETRERIEWILNYLHWMTSYCLGKTRVKPNMWTSTAAPGSRSNCKPLVLLSSVSRSSAVTPRSKSIRLSAQRRTALNCTDRTINPLNTELNPICQ